MTKISKKVAIMGLIAIIAIGITLGTASAIEPLSSPSSLILIVDKINEMITDYDNRLGVIESVINGIHGHTFIRSDYIQNTTINETNVAMCSGDEKATGGGWGVRDPGLRVTLAELNTTGYIVRVVGTVETVGTNMGVFVKCITLP